MAAEASTSPALLSPWIAVAAVAISAGALCMTALGIRQAASRTYVDQLEARVETLVDELGAERATNAGLTKENESLAKKNREVERELLVLLLEEQRREPGSG